jgi:hypothetical protein
MVALQMKRSGYMDSMDMGVSEKWDILLQNVLEQEKFHDKPLEIGIPYFQTNPYDII